jgi:hypothetical protein
MPQMMHASSLSVDVVRISHIFIVVELVLIDLNIHIYRLNRDQNGKEKVLANQYLTLRLEACHIMPFIQVIYGCDATSNVWNGSAAFQDSK